MGTYGYTKLGTCLCHTVHEDVCCPQLDFGLYHVDPVNLHGSSDGLDFDSRQPDTTNLALTNKLSNCLNSGSIETLGSAFRHPKMTVRFFP